LLCSFFSLFLISAIVIMHHLARAGILLSVLCSASALQRISLLEAP
jgi:hypothetical protein